jgi:hypothetical protein
MVERYQPGDPEPHCFVGLWPIAVLVMLLLAALTGR